MYARRGRAEARFSGQKMIRSRMRKSTISAMDDEEGPDHCEEDFFRSLQEKGILVDRVKFSATYNAVIGTVRVVNLAYEKKVVVRCTFDNWNTFLDLHSIWAGSLGNSERPVTEKFFFLIPLPNPKWSGCVEFAVRY